MAFVKKNPKTLIAGQKPGDGRPSLVNRNIQKAMTKRLLNAPTTTAKQQKKTVPGLANMYIADSFFAFGLFLGPPCHALLLTVISLFQSCPAF
jgi:hypothetical protein